MNNERKKEMKTLFILRRGRWHFNRISFENSRILMGRHYFIICLPSLFHTRSLVFFSIYTIYRHILLSSLSLPLSVSLSFSWYNCDSYAQMLPASSVRNFRNCVVKRLTGILSSSCDESVNEISGNRRDRPVSEKRREVRRETSADAIPRWKLAAWVSVGNRERETTISWSDRSLLVGSLARNAGITRRSRRRDIYSPKFRRDYYPP